MQIQLGVKRRSVPVEVLHTVELLDAAYQAERMNGTARAEATSTNADWEREVP
jgi:hypothetical protein